MARQLRALLLLQRTGVGFSVFIRRLTTANKFIPKEFDALFCPPKTPTCIIHTCIYTQGYINKN